MHEAGVDCDHSSCTTSASGTILSLVGNRWSDFAAALPSALSTAAHLGESLRMKRVIGPRYASKSQSHLPQRELERDDLQKLNRLISRDGVEVLKEGLDGAALLKVIKHGLDGHASTRKARPAVHDAGVDGDHCLEAGLLVGCHGFRILRFSVWILTGSDSSRMKLAAHSPSCQADSVHFTLRATDSFGFQFRPGRSACT